MPTGKQKTSHGLILAIHACGGKYVRASLNQISRDGGCVQGNALSVGLHTICSEVVEQRGTMPVMRPANDEIGRPIQRADQACDVSDEQILDGAFEDWIASLLFSELGLPPTREPCDRATVASASLRERERSNSSSGERLPAFGSQLCNSNRCARQPCAVPFKQAVG
jgi:hypothetical protein